MFALVCEEVHDDSELESTVLGSWVLASDVVVVSLSYLLKLSELTCIPAKHSHIGRVIE